MLLVATTTAGGLAAATATVPFILSMRPSERAKVAGAPVEADTGKLEPGALMTIAWRGKPVWILLSRAESSLVRSKLPQGGS